MKKRKASHKAQLTANLLSKNGVDPVELSKKITLVAILADMVEGYSRDVQTDIKKAMGHQLVYSDQHFLDGIVRNASILQSNTSRTLGDVAENYGDRAEFLSQLIGAGFEVDEDKRDSVLEFIQKTL